MAFKDLLGDLALQLPYGSKTYTVEPIDAELGPQVQAMFDLITAAYLGTATGPTDEQAELLTDLGEQDMYPRILGPAYALMKADGMPWSFIKRAALTAMVDACVSREAAEAAWNGEGKAPNRATRRAAAKSATASRTRSPASTAGTTPGRPVAKKTTSRGRRSSTTGS